MTFSFRRLVILIALFFLLGLFAYLYTTFKADTVITPIAIPVATPQVISLGQSVEGRDIPAYVYGSGEKHLIFIGGIHGGYEWNSVFLAYKFVDYLTANISTLPKNLTVAVIPNANPDGVFKVVNKEGRFTLADALTGLDQSAGRFNAHGVDLNRNFACNWQAESKWRNKVVSAGSAPFSEPEAQALRDFILADKPQAVISWHSQSNSIYAGECNKVILPVTLDLMNVYAKASNYPTATSFDSYTITGDLEGWLTTISIPSITVELKTHETIEWEENLAGIKAIFEYYKDVGTGIK